MTAPNLKSPTTITGRTARAAVASGLTARGLLAAAEADKVHSRSTASSAPMWMALIPLTSAFPFMTAALIVT
jgi:hypothetical protein